MPLFITLHESGGALLEDAPTDSCVALTLDERASRALLALTTLESFEVAHALVHGHGRSFSVRFGCE